MLTNFLQETLEDIRNIGFTPDDIVFIGSRDGKYSCTWEEFKDLADQYYYQDSPEQEVASDLIIVFRDGTVLERKEQRGLEWWSYFKPFRMPKKSEPIKRIFCLDLGWATLEQIHLELKRKHHAKRTSNNNSQA